MTAETFLDAEIEEPDESPIPEPSAPSDDRERRVVPGLPVFD